MLINTLVTVLASIFIGYYKLKEMINNYRLNIYRQISYSDINDQKDVDIIVSV